MFLLLKNYKKRLFWWYKRFLRKEQEMESCAGSPSGLFLKKNIHFPRLQCFYFRNEAHGASVNFGAKKKLIEPNNWIINPLIIILYFPAVQPCPILEGPKFQIIRYAFSTMLVMRFNSMFFHPFLWFFCVKQVKNLMEAECHKIWTGIPKFKAGPTESTASEQNCGKQDSWRGCGRIVACAKLNGEQLWGACERMKGELRIPWGY